MQSCKDKIVHLQAATGLKDRLCDSITYQVGSHTRAWLNIARFFDIIIFNNLFILFYQLKQSFYYLFDI